MGIYISGVKGLPEQVQENKNKIKEVEEQIEGIDFEAVRQLQGQVAENTQDINNLEASIGVQNQAINGLKDRADALESKTQKITYDEQSGELTIDANVNVKRINITSAQTPLTADSMVSRDDKNAISLTGANDEISLIVGRSGTQHILNFNADGTLDIDGNPVGGGTTLYQHNITLTSPSTSITLTIIADNNTPINTVRIITNIMFSNSFRNTSNLYLASGYYGDTSNPCVVVGFYAVNMSNLYVRCRDLQTNTWIDGSITGSFSINDTIFQIA